MYRLFKSSFLFLVVFAISLSSCVKKPSGSDQADKLNNFNWKTTKTVPINIVSKDGITTKIYVYNGTQVVASGYTPFNERIEVPISCTHLTVGFTAPSEVSATSVAFSTQGEPPLKPLTITCGDASAVDPSILYFHQIYMKELYTLWEYNYKNFGWDYYVGWWNTPGGPQGQSSMTLHLDRPPVTENGVLKMYHTCKVPGCEGYQAETTPETKFTEEGTYLFEDLFPSMGDYDMNDFVLERTAVNTVSAENKIIKTELTLRVMAVGASSKIALACYMPGISANNIEKVEMFTIGEDGQETPYKCANSSGSFNINAQGLEVSARGEVIIPVFDNAMLVVSKSPQGSFFNTIAGGGINGKPGIVKLDITFTSTSNIPLTQFKTDMFIMPLSTDAALSFDQRANEIHIVDRAPTSFMDRTVFGTLDDASKPTQSKYFRAKNGFVWGIYVPMTNFRHSLEKVNLSQSYPLFKVWVETQGKDAQEWYKTPSDGKVWTW